MRCNQLTCIFFIFKIFSILVLFRNTNLLSPERIIILIAYYVSTIALYDNLLQNPLKDMGHFKNKSTLFSIYSITIFAFLLSSATGTFLLTTGYGFQGDSSNYNLHK